MKKSPQSECVCVTKPLIHGSCIVYHTTAHCLILTFFQPVTTCDTFLFLYGDIALVQSVAITLYACWQKTVSTFDKMCLVPGDRNTADIHESMHFF